MVPHGNQPRANITVSGSQQCSESSGPGQSDKTRYVVSNTSSRSNRISDAIYSDDSTIGTCQCFAPIGQTGIKIDCICDVMLTIGNLGDINK
jgi:hypothetical protein